MYKSMIILIYIVSLILVTHQTPISDPCVKDNEDCHAIEVRRVNNRRGGIKQGAIEFGSQAGQDLLNIGINKLQHFIDGIHTFSVDRGEFTRKAVEHFKALTNGRKNIVVIDNKWPNLVDVGKSYLKLHVEVPRKVSGTDGFDIYVFDQGVVTKLGDGGYLNWRYYGNAKKIDGDSKNILFSKF